TALTVTLKATPALCVDTVPVLPVELPGTAVSPGARICSLANAPALTVMAGLVLLVIAVCVTFEAVKVQLPAVLLVTLKVLVPAVNAALGGNPAFVSVEVILTVSLVLTTFQLASTALTVRVNGEPAGCGLGVPVLPVGVPGAAVSPGVSNCNLAKAPALTVVTVPVLGALVPSVMSVAVTVALPAVLKVTANALVP